ncbi:MAG: VWA domain-containing protein [Saprospiraceae bacterium]|nr:VWA domain-containing protein [Pyrinomonadaceae bacterium]
MNKIVFYIFLLLLFGLPGANAQSSRVSPSSADKKLNKRPVVQPTPTPTPEVLIFEPDTPDTHQLDDSGELIKVDTELVSIPVRILDRKNRFIGGLAKEQFKVFEDNVEQEIAYFSNESQPFTVALVLDMSYSTTFKIEEIQNAAIAFIDQLRPDDKVLVISFDEEVHMLCEATSDRKRIYGAIRQTKIANGTSLYEAVDRTMNDRLRSIKGRKAIVLFTDGVDTTSRSSHDLENLSDAMELDALIYPIRYDTFADVQAMKNKRGIGIPDSKPKSTPPIIPANNPFPFPLPGPGMGTPSDKGTTSEEYAKGEEYLDQLAVRTGGRIYLASTLENLASSFAKIASELREFYSLGYYPKDEARPGKTRKIKVRVDQTNAVVRARESYIVAKNMKKK